MLLHCSAIVAAALQLDQSTKQMNLSHVKRVMFNNYLTVLLWLLTSSNSLALVRNPGRLCDL